MSDSKEHLEAEKLKAEIAKLQRPFFSDPARWIPLLTAIGVILVSLVNLFSARSDLSNAKVELADAKFELAALEKNREELKNENMILENKLKNSKKDYEELEKDVRGFIRVLNQLKRAVNFNDYSLPEEIRIQLVKKILPLDRSKLLYEIGVNKSTIDQFIESLYLSEYGIYFVCKVRSKEELVGGLISGIWMTREEAVSWAKKNIPYNEFIKLFPDEVKPS